MSGKRNFASKLALIIIDLEKAFVMPDAPHAVKMAQDSLPACQKVIEATRKQGIPVFYVKRLYRDDGSDVEITRWEKWKEGGRAMRPQSTGSTSAEYMPEIAPQPGDYLIVKKRWSAFFKTELDLILHRLGVETVALIGTTTPNCIRTTAYDANSYDFEVIIIEDCCTSNTQEIQDANILDLKNMGAIMMTSKEYVNALPDKFPKQNLVKRIREEIELEGLEPQSLKKMDSDNIGWVDFW
jgi:nicotinamidase-related amidase